MKTIVLTGGGTAGHVTPNIALLPQLKKAGYDVKYIGSKTGMEKEIIERYGIPYWGISSGKLRRYVDVKNLTDVFRVVKGVGEAVSVLHKLKPDVVFSKGGFVAVPVVIGAYLNGIPVVCHESDMTPGLANKIAMPFAKAVCTAFPETAEHIGKDKAVFTGTPIRSVLYRGSRQKGLDLCKNFAEEKPVLLVMGGSQGSVKVNMAIRNILPDLLESFNIIHLCGKGNLDRKLLETQGYQQFEYISAEMPDILAACDAVVSRAGSNAICELLALNKPMLLIPLSRNASRGDQILNAKSFKVQGFAEVCEEEEITAERLYNDIKSLYENRQKYIDVMKNTETADGVEEVMAVINKAAE